MEKVINFTKSRFIWLAVSVGLIILFWVGTFAQGGFNFGIDFRSGLSQRVAIQGSVDISEVKDALSGMDALQVQTVGDITDSNFVIRVGEDESVKNFQAVAEKEIKESLESVFGASSVEVLSTEFVGARLAGNLSSQTVFLTVIAMALILLYIWFRFRLNYAVSAIAAVVHDVLFLMGFIGVMQLEFSTATIAAVLTIVGYSLNDTIVIFDRIRENTRLIKEKKFMEIINISITQSLRRTLITSFTTFIAVLFIFLIGTGTIKTFALSLIVGIIVGTYSSIFIASTILLGWHNTEVKRVKASAAAAVGAKEHAEEKAAPVKKADPKVEAVKQTAEEIAEATARKKKEKEKKKKKK